MPKIVSLFLLLSLISSLSLAATIGALENDDYVLEVLESGDVTVTPKDGGTGMTLEGKFKLMWTTRNPGINRNPSHPNHPVAPRRAIRWLPENESIEDIMAWIKRTNLESAIARTVEIVPISDTKRQWTFTHATSAPIIVDQERTSMESSNPFTVGDPREVKAETAFIDGRQIRWVFCRQDAVAFSAYIELPPGKGDPKISFTVTPKKEGYVSVAYTGVPSVALGSTGQTFQVLEEGAHKKFNYVMCVQDLRFPSVFVTAKNTTSTWGLVVGHGEIQSLLLPSFEDSRFGLMLEMENQLLKPILLAPLLGGYQSMMTPGKPWSFSFYFVRKNMDEGGTLEYAARSLHGFSDMRDNRGAGSLNQALERTMAFISNENGKNYAMWDSQQKYYDYFNDKMWVFKPFSPLYGLSVGIVMDDEEFYFERGLPQLEYTLSRPSVIFAPYDTCDNGQARDAGRVVGGPIGYPIDSGNDKNGRYSGIMGLYELTQQKSPGISSLSGNPTTNSVADLMTQARVYNDQSKITTALGRVNSTSSTNVHQIMDLLELAVLTRNTTAVSKLKSVIFALASNEINLFPVPVAGEKILVQEGDKIPVHGHSSGRHNNVWGFPPPVPLTYPEQIVDSWRVSRVGCQGISYSIEYLNLFYNTALLKAAGLTNDEFTRDIARWGWVGRYGSFPGDNRHFISLISEYGDALDNPPWMWNYTTMNPGHAWDFVAQALDYLVSDAFERSKGGIDFPSVSANNASSGRVRIYGAYPGNFYTETGVYLWMPKGLLTLSSREIDWIAGWKQGKVYLALMNQSFEPVQLQGTLSADRVEYGASASARSWVNNEASSSVAVSNGQFNVTVPEKGMVVLEIPATAKTEMQERLYSVETAMGSDSYKKVQAFPTLIPTGTKTHDNVHAMLIKSGGLGLTAYVYAESLAQHTDQSRADIQNVIAARLRWKQGDGAWQEEIDTVFPYEFSPRLEPGGGDFVCVLDIEKPGDPTTTIQSSPVIVLSEGTATASATAPAAHPFPDLEQDEMPSNPDARPSLSDDFINYLQEGGNLSVPFPSQPTRFDRFGIVGEGENLRYYPYSTAVGRRIAWKMKPWDKSQFITGVTYAEADARFRAQVALAEQRVIEMLAGRQPTVDYATLGTKQKEILVDMMFTEKTISPEFVEVILTQDWERMKSEMLYVRWTGHTPDQVRNKKFGVRWGFVNP